MPPNKRVKIDGVKLLGSKRLTLQTIKDVMDALPAEVRPDVSIEQFRYAMLSAKDFHACLQTHAISQFST